MRETMSIWFFCGVMFLLYGIIITTTGVYELFSPPITKTVLYELHPSLWWGSLMGLVGLFYTVRFRPKKLSSH